MGRAKQLDGIFQNAVDRPSMPKMTGVDEEQRWAEFFFHSFNLRLSLGYDDELSRCFHACLNWAAEPIGRVSSPAAGLILNNDIMGNHGAGAVAASGSGDMVKHVEAREADSMDMDEGDEEGDEEEEEEEEEEPEPVEDDNKLWPVPSPPSVSVLCSSHQEEN
jgi:hypothetical protein